MATGGGKIAGADKAVAILKSLSPKLQRKYLARAMRKGATIVRIAAQNNAKRFDDPKTKNQVWKEIVVRSNSRLARQNGGIALSVGVKGGAQYYKNNKANRAAQRVGQSYEGAGKVYYWRFLELGTQKMKAQPFMQPALADNAEKATDAIVADLNAGIDAIVDEGGS
jgi:HK97 gp10 family phage protein